MSKLLQKLERISEGSGQPLGFGAALNRSKIVPMLVMVSVPAIQTQIESIAGKEGIDALVIVIENLAKDKKVLAKIDNTKMAVPWGVSMDTVTREDVQELINLGGDFAIFSPEKTPASVLNEEKIGKILRVDPSLTDSMIRSINRLAVDAVYLNPFGEEESYFTVQQLIAYERLAGSTGKHSLAAFPHNKPLTDIESLWGLGVRGVVVDVGPSRMEQRLNDIKEAIQKLPTSRKKPGEKIRPTLPLGKVSPESADEDEEEE